MPAKKPAAKKPSAKPTTSPHHAAQPTQPDPTTDAALLALSPDYAAAPDIPVAIAVEELASLARLAKARAKDLASVGIDAHPIQTLARFATGLKQREVTWQRAR